MKKDTPRVLVIAGSDSSGGAGIQADIKTITALGGYATTAITALTVQNTLGVQDVLPLAGVFVEAQMTAVLGDIGTDAIKTGMLGTKGVVLAVAANIPDGIPIVIDPVMVATSGDVLLDKAAISALKEKLIPKATILTPNIPEAEILAGQKIHSENEMKAAGKILLGMGAKAVLIKGGHGEGDEIVDLLITNNEVTRFPHERIKSRGTHGTGCTLSSAIALGLASGLDKKKAVEMGIGYVVKTLVNAPGFGAGNGPLGHTLGKSVYTDK
ncbi:MAG: bifunctional hydroxymethylpyrimidine kinase/phosphomethylpyrimidine kinase [Sphingomonadales bacterium]